MAAHTADTGVGFPATLPGASGGAAVTHADAVLRASEERVRAAEERFRALVEQLPLVVYVDAIDDESSNIYSSPQVEAMLGYPLDEWKRDRELRKHCLEQLQQGPSSTRTVARTKATGSPSSTG